MCIPEDDVCYIKVFEEPVCILVCVEPFHVVIPCQLSVIVYDIFVVFPAFLLSLCGITFKFWGPYGPHRLCLYQRSELLFTYICNLTIFWVYPQGGYALGPKVDTELIWVYIACCNYM